MQYVAEIAGAHLFILNGDKDRDAASAGSLKAAL